MFWWGGLEDEDLGKNLKNNFGEDFKGDIGYNLFKNGRIDKKDAIGDNLKKWMEKLLLMII